MGGGTREGWPLNTAKTSHPHDVQAAPIPGHSPVGRWVGQHLSWEAKDSAGLAPSPALRNPGRALALPGLHRGCGPATLRLL